MKKKVAHYAITAMLFAILTGCASTGSGSFSCPSPSAGQCKPIDEVDAMVSHGDIGHGTIAGSPRLTTAGNYGNFSTPYPAAVITPNAPLRLQEQVMAVWIAPFQDNDGNYHEPSTIYAVVTDGAWTGNPVRALTQDSHE